MPIPPTLPGASPPLASALPDLFAQPRAAPSQAATAGADPALLPRASPFSEGAVAGTAAAPFDALASALESAAAALRAPHPRNLVSTFFAAAALLGIAPLSPVVPLAPALATLSATASMQALRAAYASPPPPRSTVAIGTPSGITLGPRDRLPSDFSCPDALLNATASCDLAAASDLGSRVYSSLMAGVTPPAADIVAAAAAPGPPRTLPPNYSLVTSAVVSVGGFVTTGLIDSGCGFPLIDRGLLGYVMADPLANSSAQVTFTDTYRAIHTIDGAPRSYQVATLTFSLVTPTGSADITCDFGVVDCCVPGFNFGIILPHAQNQQTVLADFLATTAPFLQCSSVGSRPGLPEISFSASTPPARSVVAAAPDAVVQNIHAPPVPAPAPPLGPLQPAQVAFDAFALEHVPASERARLFDGLAAIHAARGVFDPPTISNYPMTHIDTGPANMHTDFNHGRQHALRRCTPEQYTAIRAQWDAMLAAGQISLYDPAKHGPRVWVSPTLVLFKPDGSVRPANDWRPLNERTVPVDMSNMPTAGESHRALAGMDGYVKLDASQFYSQFRVHPDDVYKTAVLLPGLGVCVWNVLGMGMMNSSFVAQQASDAAVAPYLPGPVRLDEMAVAAHAYIDDTAIGAHTRGEKPWYTALIDATLDVIGRLAERGIKLNLRKCEFLRGDINFVGANLSHAGIKPMPEYLQGIAAFPPPTSPDGASVDHDRLEQMIGYFGYLSGNYFGYQIDIKPLQQALTQLRDAVAKRNKRFTLPWTAELSAAFVTVKHGLVNSIQLAPVDVRYPLVVVTDASALAYGGMILTGPPEALRPCLVYSKSFQPNEQNYDATSREAHAGVGLMKHAEPLLAKARAVGQRVIWLTDHINLSYWNVYSATSSPTSRRIRGYWDYLYGPADAAGSGGWQPIILYLKGQASTPGERDNSLADALSRSPPDASLSDAQAITAFRDACLVDLLAAAERQRLESLATVSAAPEAYPPGLVDRLAVPFSRDDVAQVPAAVACRLTLRRPPPGPLPPPAVVDPAAFTAAGIPHDLAAAAIPLNVQRGPLVAPVVDLTDTTLLAALRAAQAAPDGVALIADLRHHKQIRTLLRDGVQLFALDCPDGVSRVIVPDDDALRQALLHIAHCCSAAHFQGKRTHETLLAHHLWWPGMLDDATAFAAACLDCDRVRGGQHLHPTGHLTPIVSSRPHELIELDFVGPLPQCKPTTEESTAAAAAVAAGKTATLSRRQTYRYLLVIVDHFSGYVAMYPTASTSTTEFADALARHVQHYGLPTAVLHDGGSGLVSAAARVVLQNYHTLDMRATPLHPQSVGLVERANGSVLACLRRLVSMRPDTWFDHLPVVQRAINSAISAPRGVSPDSVIFSYVPTSPLGLATGLPEPEQVTAQALALHNTIAAEARAASVAETRAVQQRRMVEAFDAKHDRVSFAPGQLCWYTHSARARIAPTADAPTSKLAPALRLCYIVSADAATLPSSGNASYYFVRFPRGDDDTRVTRAHVERLRPCNAIFKSPEAVQRASRAPGSDCVARVMSHSGTCRANLFFTIRWEGYDERFDTVEPCISYDGRGRRQDLSDTVEVKEYVARHGLDLDASAIPTPLDPDSDLARLHTADPLPSEGAVAPDGSFPVGTVVFLEADQSECVVLSVKKDGRCAGGFRYTVSQGLDTNRTESTLYSHNSLQWRRSTAQSPAAAARKEADPAAFAAEAEERRLWALHREASARALTTAQATPPRAAYTKGARVLDQQGFATGTVTEDPAWDPRDPPDWEYRIVWDGSKGTYTVPQRLLRPAATPSALAVPTDAREPVEAALEPAAPAPCQRVLSTGKRSGHPCGRPMPCTLRGHNVPNAPVLADSGCPHVLTGGARSGERCGHDLPCDLRGHALALAPTPTSPPPAAPVVEPSVSQAGPSTPARAAEAAAPLATPLFGPTSGQPWGDDVLDAESALTAEPAQGRGLSRVAPAPLP